MSHVLLVDDQEFDLRLARRLLEKSAQWTVQTARDGETALQQLQQQEFDVVVTDLVMPGMDGLQLLEEIQSHHHRLPVVIMTSQGSEEIAVQALQKGAASYVSKRNLKRDLLRALQTVAAATVRDQQTAHLMTFLQHGEYCFDLPNDHQVVLAAVSFLQEIAQHMAYVNERERTQLGIALEEALANALVHGNLEIGSQLREDDLQAYQQLISHRLRETPYRNRRLHVSARFSSAEARFIVRDEGPGFNPHAVPDPTDPGCITRAHGRGLFLIFQFMDDVRYNETGNEITLVKRRPQLNCPSAAEGCQTTLQSV